LILIEVVVLVGSMLIRLNQQSESRIYLQVSLLRVKMRDLK
jgi:hypothetical protein